MKVSIASLLWALLFSSLTALAQAPEAKQAAAEPKDIPRYLEVSPRIGTGGQPTDAGFRLLAEKGYKAVINLRTANEKVDLEAEKKLIESLGLRYYGIPVVGLDPREEQAQEFLKLMEELKGEKVFVHCAAANRVGGFMLIQRVLQEGMPIEKAEEEAARIGLRSEKLRDFAREFIRKYR